MNDIQKTWESRAQKMGNTKKGVLFKRLPSFLNNYIHRQHESWLLDACVDTGINNVLDLGCGYGRLSNLVKAGSEEAHFFGVDLSESFCTNYAKNIGRSYCGSVFEAPYDRKYNLIISVTIQMYLSENERSRYVDMLSDLLEEDGRILVIEPALEFQRLWRKIFRRENAEATGGGVTYFNKTEFLDSHLEKFNLLKSGSINLLPGIPSLHHSAIFCARGSS